MISRSLSLLPVKIFWISASRSSLIFMILPVKGYISFTSIGIASFLLNSIFITDILFMTGPAAVR